MPIIDPKNPSYWNERSFVIEDTYASKDSYIYPKKPTITNLVQSPLGYSTVNYHANLLKGYRPIGVLYVSQILDTELFHRALEKCYNMKLTDPAIFLMYNDDGDIQYEVFDCDASKTQSIVGENPDLYWLDELTPPNDESKLTCPECKPGHYHFDPKPAMMDQHKSEEETE